jgi:hypothetical protein
MLFRRTLAGNLACELLVETLRKAGGRARVRRRSPLESMLG